MRIPILLIPIPTPRSCFKWWENPGDPMGSSIKVPRDSRLRRWWGFLLMSRPTAFKGQDMPRYAKICQDNPWKHLAHYISLPITSRIHTQNPMARPSKQSSSRLSVEKPASSSAGASGMCSSTCHITELGHPRDSHDRVTALKGLECLYAPALCMYHSII